MYENGLIRAFGLHNRSNDDKIVTRVNTSRISKNIKVLKHCASCDMLTERESGTSCESRSVVLNTVLVALSRLCVIHKVRNCVKCNERECLCLRMLIHMSQFTTSTLLPLAIIDIRRPPDVTTVRPFT